MKWHKVSEELPKNEEMVLLYVKGNCKEYYPIYKLGYRYEKKWMVSNDPIYTLNYFTHWAQIEPPEEDK